MRLHCTIFVGGGSENKIMFIPTSGGDNWSAQGSHAVLTWCSEVPPRWLPWRATARETVC